LFDGKADVVEPECLAALLRGVRLGRGALGRGN